MVSPTFSRARFLETPTRSFEHKVYKLIAGFAVLGYTDVAFKLLSLLNTHEKPLHFGNVLEPLWLVWDSLGTWPDGEREKVDKKIGEKKRSGQEYSQSAKKRKMEQYIKEQRATDEEIRRQVEEMGHKYAKEWPYPGSDDERPHTNPLNPAQKSKAIKTLLDDIEKTDPMGRQHKDAETGWAAMDASAKFVSALHLALELEATRGDGQNPKADSEIETPPWEDILQRIAQRISANRQVEYLAKSQETWNKLEKGALRGPMNIDTEALEDFAAQVEDALATRLKDGKLQLTIPPMQRLLDDLDAMTRENNAREAADGSIELNKETILRAPAKPAQIAAAEKKLKIDLPQDYKDFLAVTNGCEPILSYLLYESPLFPVDKLRWFDKDYFTDLTLTLLEIPMLDAHPTPTVGRGIELGTEDIYCTWLIPPSTVDDYKTFIRGILHDENVSADVRSTVERRAADFAGSLDAFWDLGWCCVTWASGGVADMQCYSGFGAYLASMLWRGSAEKQHFLDQSGFWGNAFRKDGGNGEES